MNLQNWKISKQVIEVEDQLPKERILDYTDQEGYVADYQWRQEFQYEIEIESTYSLQSMKMNLQNWKISKLLTEVEDQLPKERILDQDGYVADYQWRHGIDN